MENNTTYYVRKHLGSEPKYTYGDLESSDIRLLAQQLHERGIEINSDSIQLPPWDAGEFLRAYARRSGLEN